MNKEKIIKIIILFMVILFIVFSNNLSNTYAGNVDSNKIAECLPETIIIPIEKSYIIDNYNILLKTETVSQTMSKVLQDSISKILEENQFSNYTDYVINSYDNEKISIYISPIENSDTFVLNPENYINFIKNGYFDYYYRITSNGTTDVKPFRVYLNEEINNSDYNIAEEIANNIQESYNISIGEIYELHKKWDTYNYVIDRIKVLLESKGINMDANIDIEYYPLAAGNYESSTENLNDYFNFDLSISVNDKWMLIKSVKYRVDNNIIIPDNIETTTSSYINYLNEYLKEEYFHDKDLEVVYENGNYILKIDSYKCLLNPQKTGCSFEYGHGTKEDPYIINNIIDLNNVRYYLNSYFKLNSDLNLQDATINSDGEFYNNGQGWLPIADNEEKFSGEFDGNGHTIIGLTINRFDNDFNGLFGYVDEFGVIKNLILKDININGNHYIGGITGINCGKIDNVAVYGNIIFKDSEDNSKNVYIGGIAGDNYGKIINAINYANIEAIVNTQNHTTNGAGITAHNGIKEMVRIPMHFEYSSFQGSVQQCMNFGNITIKNTCKSNYKYTVYDGACAAGIVVQNNANVIDVANIGKIIGNNVAGIICENQNVFNAYNIGELILYSDFYTGTEEMKLGSAVKYNGNIMYGVYGYNPYNNYEQLPEEIALDDNKTNNKFETLNFEDIWKADSKFNYPVLKDIEIQTKDINIEVNNNDVDVYLSNPTSELNYKINNLDYDYLIFESDNPNVDIDKNGKITILGENNETANITVRTLFNSVVITRKINFKVIDDTYIIGDANLDGKISALDYVKIKNHIMGINIITNEKQLKAADANDDGKISALDYVRIKNYIMNGGK